MKGKQKGKTTLGQLRKVRKADGQITVIARGARFPTGLAVAAGYGFWSDWTIGVILRLPIE